MCLLHLEILVVERKLLGFVLLLGFDAVKKLKGVHLNELGEVHFLAENLPGCATIKIDEPNFSTVFDQRKWTTSWKWAGSQMTVEQLKNRV